jgi:hypothetical protein
LKRIIRQLKVKKQHIGAGLGVALVVFSLALGFSNSSNSKAHAAITQLSTPAVTLCGSTALTTSGPYSGPALIIPANGTTAGGQASASKTVIPAMNGFFRYWNNGSNSRWYVMTSSRATTFGFTVYNATTNSSTPLGTFNVPIPSGEQGERPISTFAVDPSGDIYVGSYNVTGGDVLSRWSWTIGTNTTATEVWHAHLPSGDLMTGGIYGYTDGSSVFRVAGVVTNGSNRYSVTYNGSSGAALANNVVVGNVINVSAAHGNDIVSADGNGNGGYVRVYNSTGTTQTIYFGNGTNTTVFGFKYLDAATELANGTFVVADGNNNGLMFVTASGAFIGEVADSLGGVINTGVVPMTNAIGNVSNLAVVGGDYFYETGVSNPFSNPQDLVKVTAAEASNIITAPQVSHFGLGAGLATTATQNYYASGATPVVNVQFDPWWATSASNYSLKYTIQTIQQVTASNYNTVVTPTVVPLATIMGAPNNGTLSLALPTANPDLYQVDAHIIDNSGNQVGGQCLNYSVGASGDSYNPATIAALGGANQQAVAVGSELNQTLMRQQNSFTLDDCLLGYSAASPPTTSTPLACPPSVVTDMNAAADMGASSGVKFEFQVAAGSGLDSWLFNNHTNGVWQSLATKLATTFSHVKYWEALNETQNTYTSNGATWLDNVAKPFYQGIKAANIAGDVVIGGSDANVQTGFANQVAAADSGHGFDFMDAFGVHPYTGNNRSWEEEGMVAQIQKIQAILTSAGHSGMPIYTTESGFWQNGTNPYATQGNKLIRKLILGNSIGLNNDYYYYNTQTGNDGSGVFWGLIDSQGIDTGGLASITYKHMVKGLAFDGAVSTSIPHTFAYKYGPTISGSYVYVVWAQDFNVDATVTLTGGAAMTLTDEYGGPTIAPTTLASGGTVHLNGSVQYLTAPNANQLTITGSESYGTDYAAQTQGALATDETSSTGSPTAPSNCGPTNANDAIADTTNIGDVCNGMSAWSSPTADSNPYLDIKLGTAKTIDRVYVAGTGLGSDKPGVRGFTISVSKDNGATYTPVTTVANAFYQSDFMLPIGTQSGVTNLRLSSFSLDYNGYGDGFMAVWCVPASSCPNYFGIYTVEAYSPGSGSASVPTVSVTSPASAASVHTTTTITASATDNSGSGLQKVEFYVDGSLVGTDTTGPFTYAWNTLTLSNGSHTLTTKAYDNNGGVTTSAPVVVSVDNGDADDNGHVDAADLSRLAYNWNKSGMTYLQGNFYPDTNGTINAQDLSILALHYGWVGP